MRIWDVPPSFLCDHALLEQHRDIHAVWGILTEGRNAYNNDPEVLRWQGKLGALWWRHFRTVVEMERRGYYHCSPLPPSVTHTYKTPQTEFVNMVEEQMEMLRGKGCPCRV